MGKRPAFRAVTLLGMMLLTIATSPVFGHPDEHFDAARHAVQQYLLGMLDGDDDMIREVSVENIDFGSAFTNSLGGPGLASASGFSNVDMSHAKYQLTPTGIVVGPVAVAIEKNAFVYAWEFGLKRGSDNKWRVASVHSATEVPDSVFEQGLAEQLPTVAVEISIRDDDGQPVPARINIRDADGDYWPPRFHERKIRTLFRDDIGGDVLVDGKTYAYVESAAIADLPKGHYTLEAHKGMEFEPSHLEFDVSANGETTVDVTMKRWVDMNARGWYSGDTHVHFIGDQLGLLEAKAEALNIINVLVAKWGALITDAGRFTGKPSLASNNNTVVYVNQEARHGWLGHTTLLRLKKLVHPLSWGDMQEGVYHGFDYPAMGMQADAAHKQDGLVTWAHFPFPDGEVVVDVALGKIDAVDLFTWGDAFYDGIPQPDDSRIYGKFIPGPVAWWYKFLNTGSRLPVTAGTDKMLNTHVVGSVRTYAQLGEQPFSYDGWIEAVRAGRTFVTTGPFVTLSVDGKPIGSILTPRRGETLEVLAKVEVPPGYPADVLEIVQNGRVIESVELGTGDRTQLEVSVSALESGWIAARVRGSELLPYQRFALLGTKGVPAMAHTSPIYIEIDDEPAWSAEDARFLLSHINQAIDWAKKKGRYATPQQKDEVISLYQSALEGYERRLQAPD